tara:strand:+ start:706 stop:942 length:237 start_codon:yes stop_codon:yes gene_type:complete
MSGIFSPKTPKPDPEIKESQLRQEELLKKREAKEAAAEVENRRSISARARARRTGGMRLLLSTQRDNPATGLRTTLGV